MNNNQKNIDLTQNGFAQNLRTLREAAHLSQADLAEKAGLTYRTVHDLELGKRKRSQEKTLLLLARALDISLEELLGSQPAANVPAAPTGKRAVPPSLLVGAAMLVVLALSATFLWHQSCAKAEWTLDGGQLIVRDRTLGTRLWEITGNEPLVTACMASPWNDCQLLVSLGRRAPGSGSLLCLNRASGDTIWSIAPDIAAVVRAFGAEDVMASKFSCRKLLVADLDGDGDPEIIAPFSHGKYYPFLLCTVRSDGTLRAQYAHKGHLYGFVVDDYDADGKDEVIATGVTNNRAYIGATVLMLDGDHCGGASIDSLCNPWSSEIDSALIRVVIPNYPGPYMQQLRGGRLAAWLPQVFSDARGQPRLSVQIHSGNPEEAITAFFDGRLRPVSAQPDDVFLDGLIPTWPDSLTNGTGPGDPDWLANWLGGYLRFEMGALVH